MLPSFYPISKKAYVELMVGRKVEGTPVPHMLLSQRPDPKEKQVINLDQDVHVCEYLGGWCMNSFHEPSLSLSISFFGHGLSLSLFFFFEYLDLHVSNFFFFHHAFLSMSFIYFCIAHVLFLEMITWRE